MKKIVMLASMVLFVSAFPCVAEDNKGLHKFDYELVRDCTNDLKIFEFGGVRLVESKMKSSSDVFFLNFSATPHYQEDGVIIVQWSLTYKDSIKSDCNITDKEPNFICPPQEAYEIHTASAMAIGELNSDKELYANSYKDCEHRLFVKITDIK